MSTFWSGPGEHGIPIGGRKIIFVAHSMGGLIVKKTYILGKHDSNYADLIDQVYGIIFLGTPHRGSQYAKTLNNILSTAPFGAPPKAYIADLEIHAVALQDINEQFRSQCANLALVSFFETHKISVGLKVLVGICYFVYGMTNRLFQQVVEKESAILGYPQETSTPLNGDHHTICKFRNREDANYQKIRNVLKQWVVSLHRSRKFSSP